MKLLLGFQFHFSFFTIFSEKITGMRQFSSNEQILQKHVKNEENRDFDTDFRWYTDFIWICGYTDLYEFLIFEKNGFLP